MDQPISPISAPSEPVQQFPSQPTSPAHSRGPMITLIVVGILVLAGGVFAYTKLTSKSETTPPPSASTTPSANSNEKTYTSSQYNFAFEYPATWTTSEKNESWNGKATTVIRLTSPELAKSMQNCGTPCEASPYNLSVAVSNTNNWTLDQYVSQESDLNNKTATTLGGVPAIEGTLDGASTYYVVFAAKNGKIYELYFDNTPNKAALTADEQHILSTFKFTTSGAPASWKTYTSAQYSYTLQYPESFGAHAISGDISGVGFAPPANGAEAAQFQVYVIASNLTPAQWFETAQAKKLRGDAPYSVQYRSTVQAGSHTVFVAGPGDLGSVFHIFSENGKLIVFTSVTGEETLLPQIISTFKFTTPTTVSKTGYLICLQPKPTAPIQYCEYGLKDSQGNKYYLSGNIQAIQGTTLDQRNNLQFSISGTLISETHGFDVVGTIDVTSLTY